MSLRSTVWASPIVFGYWLHFYREFGSRLHLTLEHDPSGGSWDLF